MLQRLKKRNKGFTIIEVLIVLAIAGLIMVVVFLAVPALNRNARNNQTKTEANNLLSAYTEISNNKGGAVLLPADVADLTKAANLQNISSVTIQTTAPPALAGVTDVNNAYIVTGKSCPTDITARTLGTGTTRSIALYYAIESANSATKTVSQCIGNN